MSELLAHLSLFGRHFRRVTVLGTTYRYCVHISHHRGLKCYRWVIHDGYCSKHNSTCYINCPTEVAVEEHL